MINLANSKVNRQIGKRNFYGNLDAFSKIIWSYKVAKSTCNIGESVDYLELQIFHVELRETATSDDIDRIKIIQKNIPYKILFIIANKSYIVVDEEVIIYDGLLVDNDQKLLADGHSVQAIYANILEQFFGEKLLESEDADAFGSRMLKTRKIKRKLQSYQNAVDKEQNPRKRFELNDELKAVKKELEDIM